MNIFNEIIMLTHTGEFIEVEIRLSGHGQFEGLTALHISTSNEVDDLRASRAVGFARDLLGGAKIRNIHIMDVLKRLPKTPDFIPEMLILKKIAERQAQIFNTFNEVAA